MLRLGWVLLWLSAGERIMGFDHSDCYTRKLVWAHSVRREEKLVLFCDLPEPSSSHNSKYPTAQDLEDPPCVGKVPSDVQWFMQPRHGGPLEEISNSSSLGVLDKGMLYILASQMDNAESYICRPKIRNSQERNYCVKMNLEVTPQTNASCKSFFQNLVLGQFGLIHCPSLSCSSDKRSPEMTWYQNGSLCTKEKRDPLRVDDVYDFHQGTYVCDYTQSDNVSSWTVRAVVEVKTNEEDTTHKPSILDPNVRTMEVELGKPLTLSCRVQFGFQQNFTSVIRWNAKDSTKEWEVTTCKQTSTTFTGKSKVIECTAFLKEVTRGDLSREFVCFAQNSVGNTTHTIQLREKKGVVFMYILLGTILTLVGVLVTSALLYIHWIEIVLLCRTYQCQDETLNDKKEFDAFVSYEQRSTSGTGTASSLSEEHLALTLFPDILENKYGYSLCLLERDVAPGGVYADDIVSIIKKSRRGIFILTPSYVNGPRVFELQAAVNLALVDPMLKLILIKFCSFQEPESLPHLVQKALRVLPTVTWKGCKSVHPSSRFWTHLRYHMPKKSAKRFKWNQLRIPPSVCFTDRNRVRRKPWEGRRGSGTACQDSPEALALQPPGEEVPMGSAHCMGQVERKPSFPSLSCGCSLGFDFLDLTEEN